MNRIRVMVNGIPGNMASNVARHILVDDRFDLISQSLTGPEITESEHSIGSVTIRLIHPDVREQAITEIVEREGPFISVDYTHPSAVNGNAEFYSRHDLPFVMGTTGGDRKQLEDTVCSSSIPAVIAPNMAEQIVGFQAMMEWTANTFPGLFKGYSLEIKESHQKGKADTSGTAKAMVGYFNNLGVPFSEEDIRKERDPEVQKTVWGIPEEHLAGHGWHTYSLVSNDRTVSFEFSHNVNGRDVYAKGTLDAITYLHNKVQEGAKGRVYTMIDVLKGS
ncbi:MAG: dihydrodipicolinate reductase [Desulfobacterales bacterium]|nr:dihydrodipicolinate reductase [Desulfobacterales bacterium]